MYNIKDLRNRLINDILIESGEVIFEGRKSGDWGLPLSQRFYNTDNKDTGALPNFSQKSYKYDNEYDIKRTRFGYTADDMSSIKKRTMDYCAVATEDDHVVLGMCKRDVDDYIVQHSADLFLKEKYGLRGGHYGVRRGFPSFIVDELGTRFVSLDDYEKTLIKYLTENVYPKKFNKHLRDIKEEDEETAYDPAAANSRFWKKMRQRKEADRLAREEKRKSRDLEDQKWYDSQKTPSSDPFDIILNQIKKDLLKKGESEVEINFQLNAHRNTLKEIGKLYTKFTFGTRGDYMSNGLLNVLNMRYGLRTIVRVPDSIWNAQ